MQYYVSPDLHVKNSGSRELVGIEWYTRYTRELGGKRKIEDEISLERRVNNILIHRAT